MTLRLGVTLPQFVDDGASFRDGVRRAEEAGLDSIWLFDHLWPLSGGKERPVHECWSALAWAAGATERIRLGTLVTRSTLRHPEVLARMADTVGAIAPGRLTIGIGSGDAASRSENEAFGIPYLSGDRRREQLAEAIARLTAVLEGESVLPVRGPRPPLWVGGRSPAALDLAIRSADGWNGWGGSAEAFGADVERLRAAAGDRKLTITWAGTCLLGVDDEDGRARLGRRDPDAYLWGGPDRVARHLRAYAARGAEEVILVFPDAAESGPYETLAGPVRDLL